MKTKTLEQLIQHLKKAMRKGDHPWLDELVNRVDVSYLKTLDATLSESDTSAENDKGSFGFRTRAGGWFPISELPANNMFRALLFFPYNKENECECFKEEYRNPDLPVNSVYYAPQFGYEVLAVCDYGEWHVQARPHTHTESISIPLDISKATHFKLFAGTVSNVTREGVLQSNRNLRRSVEELKKALELKNTELDALAYVWCTGPCAGGQYRYTEPKEITFDMIKRMVCVVHRLYSRGANSLKISESRNRWFESNRIKAKARIDRVGETRIDFLSKMVDGFRDSTEMKRRTTTVEVVTEWTNDEDKFPNESGMLSELLARGVVRADPVCGLVVIGDDWFAHAVTEISISDVPAVYEAASVPGGLWVWWIERNKNRPCRFVVDKLKELSLWKPEWDNLK